jgi:serine/threonine protein phosphatase PrpC
MDLLRKLFGLQPAPAERRPPSTMMDGPTAPLDVKITAGSKKDEADPDNTNILDDGRTQKLPDIDTAMSDSRAGRQITFGQFSDVGQARTNNQDSVLTFLASSSSVDDQPEFGIFVVADGMGGHHDGEKASALTARVVAHHLSSEIFLPMLAHKDPDAERPTISEILREAVQKANDTVVTDVPEGGTTVTAAAIMGDLAYIGHVGDSRAYIIDKNNIEQLTRDHSLVRRLIELEQLTEEEALEHPQRNVLYRAIGQNETIDVDAITRRLQPGSRLLICSDGLWNLVPTEEIKSVVFSSSSPQQACEQLVKLANDRGGPDNISVILVKIPE